MGLVDAYEDYNCFGEVSFFVASKVSKWNKVQQLSFCVKVKKTATETFEILKSAYGEERSSRISVFECHIRFREVLEEMIGINKETVRTILVEDLKKKKVCALFLLIC
jgi:hypothetical protein